MAYNRWIEIQRDATKMEFKGSHFERELILWGIRWYVAHPISYRHLEEMLEERGVEVDDFTLNCPENSSRLGGLSITHKCTHRCLRAYLDIG